MNEINIHCFTGQTWTGFFTSISELNSNLSGTEEQFLHNKEINVFVSIRSKSYRESWLAGRLLTKKIYINRCMPEQNLDWKDIQIVSRNSLGHPVPPRLLANGTNTGFMFSLSHVADKVMVVVPIRPTTGIGCDLVYRETTTPGIVKTFFHDTEIQDQQDKCSFDAIWAVKEAAYKSCNTYESFQPRQWLTQKIAENRFFCRHLDLRRHLFVEAETFTLGEYILAVAKKA